MTEIPKPCQDCVNEPTCDAECTGHLTEEQWLALSRYWVWKYTNKIEEQNNEKVGGFIVSEIRR